MQIQLILSSKDLYNELKAISKVVSSKTTVPALGCFHFEAWNHQLFVTGSDIESTIKTSVEVHKAPAEGKFLLEHRLLMEALKELPEQPITINVDTESFQCEIIHESGKFNVVGQNPDDFVTIENQDEEPPAVLSMESHVLVNGLKTVLPYASNDELRPVMNSIFCEIKDEKMYFVASNANYLAQLVEPNVNFHDIGFMLSPKVSKIISDLAEGEDLVKLEIGSHTIKANFGEYEIVSRLVEGNYPNYRTVIPQNNENNVLVNVSDFIGSLKRTTIFSNKNSSLVTIATGSSNLVLTGKDIDFSISATENIACEYSGDQFEIGFKAPFLQQCLQSIDTDEVKVSMKDALGAALFTPVGDECQALTLLLMPMMINV